MKPSKVNNNQAKKGFTSDKNFLMASLQIMISIAIVAVVVPQALAKEFVVGDDIGWTTKFDYQTWAEGKDFRVGDKLIFKYTKGVHNVFRVDATAFQQCVAPATNEALTTGNDVITLTTSGKKWYICGVGQHCEAGNQKLAITVFPQVESPASSPSGGDTPSSTPHSAARGITVSKYHVWMIAALSILVMIMV